MIIRDAELKDAEKLDLLLTKLIRDEAQYDRRLNRDCVIENNYCGRIGLDGHKAIIAEEDGEVVGYVYGFIYEIPGIYTAPIAILDALYVEEAHRRKGCATGLISAFLTFAAENGAVQVELKAVSANKAAVELYSKLSFRETKKYMTMELQK